ncbi:MAG: hypothetical protein Fues2KO_02800 [Fuerstiella sp.]
MLLLVTLPLAALTWTGLRLVENEKVVAEQNFRILMTERLKDINSDVAEYLNRLEIELNDILTAATFETQLLRETARNEPRILQLFVLQHDGRLQHPDPMAPLTDDERTFLVQAAKMFTGQDLHDTVLRTEQRRNRTANDAVADDNSDAVSEETQSAQRGSPRATGQRSKQVEDSNGNDAQVEPTSTREQVQATDTSSRRGIAFNSALPGLPDPIPYSQDDNQPAQRLIQDTYSLAPVRNMKSFAAGSGWFTWYWDRGLNLIYWQRRPSGHIVGCALERARWMADLIAELPETVSGGSAADGPLASRVKLVNSSAALVYQWGAYEPAGDAVPLCELPLPAPLASWRLRCFIPTDELLAGTGRSARFSLVTSLLMISAVVAVIVLLLVREYRRDMRAAEQQVSFVNQVSHELKTPLTNIRMYAEMLESDLQQLPDDEVQRPRQRLDIILSEGQRLSRLIGNVLTFARQKRRSLQVQALPIEPDELIRRIVERFQPALQELQIETVLDLNVAGSMKLDPDFLEQILGNLISNVEKYAAEGGLLKIESRRSNDLLTIDVTDQGPGIPADCTRTVFEPFARVSNDLSYAAGTGIGLPIARELARLHGGDVCLLSADDGCVFRVTMKATG